MKTSGVLGPRDANPYPLPRLNHLTVASKAGPVGSAPSRRYLEFPGGVPVELSSKRRRRACSPFGPCTASQTTRAPSYAALNPDWRTQVWSDLRPANIFNATLVDTGERVLLGTSRLGWREERGLRNFEEVYKNRDVQVVTAARLAASFAYISPAARPHDSGDAYHIVDGGYYDDYGMLSAMALSCCVNA